jgi:hypothetical protein
MEIILLVLFIAFVLWLLSKILVKAGFEPIWAFAMLIPIVNVLLVWFFAFAAWPNSQRKESLWKL